MEKSFASLLRHSKLATFDRRLNQVYSSPKQCKQRGDWGLKRNLPTVIRTPFVTVGQLDTNEHQTPWDSGHSQVAFLHRWKENFGSSTKHRRPRPDEHYRNLTNMTRAQFDHFLKHTITPATARAFHQALQCHQLTRDQVYDYLQVTFRPDTRPVVGPVYSHDQPHDEITVQGRILNTQKGGYAVGIGGVVAFLPKRYAVGVKKPGDRFLVRSFYVRRAYVDDQGKPQVTLSLYPRPETTASSLSDMVSSPTSALPTSPSRSIDTHLFAAAPPSTIDDLHSFLLHNNSSTSSTVNQGLAASDPEWMNRIIGILENECPPPKKKN